MTILRKIFGAILLLLSLYIAFGFLLAVIKVGFHSEAKSGAERLGEIFGIILFSAIMFFAVRFLIRKALKLFKNKPQDNIDEIGQL